jgi:hypothetical protein
LHETAVFRKIFGPFANFWRPQAIFLGSDAADLHSRAIALVRDFDPVYWNVFEASEADAAFEVLIARLREELTPTETRRSRRQLGNRGARQKQRPTFGNASPSTSSSCAW